MGFWCCWFQKWSPFCKKSLLDLTWPPWPLKIDLRWSIMVAHYPYWYVYQTICFKWWSGQKWCQIVKKKLFDLIMTLSLPPWPLMTAEGPKWKLWKYTDMYIKLWVFNGADFKNGVHFAKRAFITSHDLHDCLKLTSGGQK